jgi:hypothetical protein
MASADDPGRPQPINRPDARASKTPTAAFDGKGRLWLAWIEGTSNVFVSSSTDLGQTFTEAVRVTPSPEQIDATGDGRPKIAVGRRGEVLVSWTLRKEMFNGDIRFARSLDEGRTFTAPVTINDDGEPVGHRFDTLAVSPAGDVYLTWIDKRDQERALKSGRTYSGGALYFTVSRDGGATFAPNRKVKDYTCECCRIAVDFDESGLPVLVWRDVIDGKIRDHALVRFLGVEQPGPPIRATHDGWAIDACPHHGPSLSIADDGTYHLVWFTGSGPDGPGSFYARSTDQGRSFSAPVRLGTEESFGHPFVLSAGRHVLAVWKDRASPGSTAIRGVESSDGGLTWTPSRELARTRGASDHPFLLESDGRFFLSWFTTPEGYRLIPAAASRSVQGMPAGTSARRGAR